MLNELLAKSIEESLDELQDFLGKFMKETLEEFLVESLKVILGKNTRLNSGRQIQLRNFLKRSNKKNSLDKYLHQHPMKFLEKTHSLKK